MRMDKLFGIDVDGHVVVKVKYSDGTEEVVYNGKNTIKSAFREYLSGSLASFPVYSGAYFWYAMDYSSLKIMLRGTIDGSTPKYLYIGPFTITPQIGTDTITLATGDKTYTIQSSDVGSDNTVTITRVNLMFKTKQAESISSSSDPDSLTIESYSYLAEQDITDRTLAVGDQIVVNWTVTITVSGADVSALNSIWTAYNYMDNWKILMDDGSGSWSIEATENRQDINDSILNHKVTWSAKYTASSSVTITKVKLSVTYNNTTWYDIMVRNIGSLSLASGDSITVEFTFQA